MTCRKCGEPSKTDLCPYHADRWTACVLSTGTAQIDAMLIEWGYTQTDIDHYASLVLAHERSN